MPWAEPGSQFTGLFERMAIDLLRGVLDHGRDRATFASAGTRAGDRRARGQAGLARGPEVVAWLGVDHTHPTRRAPGLKRDGDEWLAGSKYLWLRRPADLHPEQRVVLRALQREDFKVSRA